MHCLLEDWLIIQIQESNVQKQGINESDNTGFGKQLMTSNWQNALVTYQKPKQPPQAALLTERARRTESHHQTHPNVKWHPPNWRPCSLGLKFTASGLPNTLTSSARSSLWAASLRILLQVSILTMDRNSNSTSSFLFRSDQQVTSIFRVPLLCHQHCRSHQRPNFTQCWAAKWTCCQWKCIWKVTVPHHHPGIPTSLSRDHRLQTGRITSQMDNNFHHSTYQVKSFWSSNCNIDSI